MALEWKNFELLFPGDVGYERKGTQELLPFTYKEATTY